MHIKQLGALRVAHRNVSARAEGGEGTHWYERPCGPNSIEVSSVQELVDVLVRCGHGRQRLDLGNRQCQGIGPHAFHCHLTRVLQLQNLNVPSSPPHAR